MTIKIFLTLDLSKATKEELESSQKTYEPFIDNAYECLKEGIPTQIKITNLPMKQPEGE